MAFPDSGHERSSGWEERALRRSLDLPRARSVNQMHRLVGAARDLANSTGSAAFTVAQVAARAKLSIKVFYRCFAGKDDLLLALLEEDSATGAGLLASHLEGRQAPADRVRGYVEGIFELLTHPGAVGYAGVLVREYRRLGEDRPQELALALAPLVGLLATELAAAHAAGVAEIEDPDRAAATLFGILLGGINEVTTGRADPLEMASWLWRFSWSGLAGSRLVGPAPNADKKRGHP